MLDLPKSTKFVVLRLHLVEATDSETEAARKFAGEKSATLAATKSYTLTGLCGQGGNSDFTFCLRRRLARLIIHYSVDFTLATFAAETGRPFDQTTAGA